jgi:uncharacterized membrane-anchored protein
MNRKKIAIALFAVILFQGAVLAGEYLNAIYPHWTGTEIRLKTVPVDPRSLFRGNYARMSYDISTLPRKLYKGQQTLRENELLYVSLTENSEGLYEASKITLQKPDSGLFIRGRLERRLWTRNEDVRLRFGIEAFFAQKHAALALEKELRNGGIAVLMVARNGKAALKDVVGD